MSDPLGVDVAYPQGPDYDWRQWRGKISFGMCKVTEGLTITGPYFANNWNAAELHPDAAKPLAAGKTARGSAISAAGRARWPWSQVAFITLSLRLITNSSIWA